jgi:general secretion pathway protein G
MYKIKGGVSYEIVITAIGLLILCGFLVIGTPISVKLGRTAQADADTAMLVGKISEYDMEIGSYPDSLTDLTSSNGQYDAWVNKIPTDPWGNAYIYKKTTDGFVVYSLGSNGVDDGSSVSAIANGDVGYIGK